MKCIFKDELCQTTEQPGGRTHDDCRNCKNVPNMVCGEEDDLESKYLCAVAGQRERQKKYYGSFDAKTPAWFDKLLRTELEQLPCADHIRYLKNSVISEPYSVCQEEIEKLIKYCKKHNLEFIIDGDAAWFPGRTFRIQIFKKHTKI